MKIIGYTGDHFYLAEMSGDELAQSGRPQSQFSFPGLRNVNRFLGAAVEVNAAYRFIETLKMHERQATEAASMLRALATLIGKALPTTYITPAEPDAAEAAQ